MNDDVGINKVWESIRIQKTSATKSGGYYETA